MLYCKYINFPPPKFIMSLYIDYSYWISIFSISRNLMVLVQSIVLFGKWLQVKKHSID